ncbi:MAG TPA: tetratricopeptide repeat protein, partial [Thermomicrobiales bacterium]|nr:tetratricopeptide repeat protein [Thermomicrobiales bacterium]
MTSFVGRDRDSGVIARQLVREDVRLVTLTGPGGVGKTRLAFHVADQLKSSFPDGVVTIDLATITSPDLVLTAIARAFDITDSGVDSVFERLLRVIGDRRILVLVDNFEQVASAGTVISQLMSARPNVTFLVTSRMPLHIVGEHEYAVGSLETPPSDPRDRAGRDIADYAAVKLFIQRAQAAHRSFEPSSEMLETIGRITTLLDGLPLAIELAAARTKLFSLPALLSRLDDRMGLLTGGPRDLPDRLQTMRNAIAWSHDLLSDDEKLVFRRVSVFVDSFSLEAAETVIGQSLTDEERAFIGARDGVVGESAVPADVLTHLESLVDKSLLQVVTGIEDDIRFRMMLTIQEYARHQLHVAHESLLMRVRALRYLSDYIAEAEELLIGPEQRIWLSRLDLELGNLRQALQLAIDNPREFGETGIRMASSVWRYWLTRGQVVEGARWLEQALACRSQIDLPALVEAEAVNHLGNLRLELGDHRAAEEDYKESLAIYRSVGYQNGIADELNNLGLVQLFQGKMEAARTSLQESLALRRDGGDERALPATLSNLGDLAVDEEQYDVANEYYAEALRIRREIGNLRGMAFSCYSLGMVAFYRNEFDHAQAWFDEGLEYQEQLDDVYSLALMMLGLGRLNLATGNTMLAMERLNRAIEVLHKMGSRRMTAVVIDVIAMAAERHGFDREAARLLGTTHRVRTEQNVEPTVRSRRETDRIIAVLKTRLGNEGFEREFAVGQRQWLNQAVQEALSLTKRIRERVETGDPSEPSVSGVFDPVAAAKRAKELGLTKRERQVLELLVKGAADKEIADMLSIAPRTAMTHVSNILAKL